MAVSRGFNVRILTVRDLAGSVPAICLLCMCTQVWSTSWRRATRRAHATGSLGFRSVRVTIVRKLQPRARLATKGGGGGGDGGNDDAM